MFYPDGARVTGNHRGWDCPGAATGMSVLEKARAVTPLGEKT